MSKTIWKALKLGPAVLGASFLVANSALAGQAASDTMTQARKSTATSDKPTDSQFSADKSVQGQREQVKSEAEGLKVSKAPLAANVANSGSVKRKQVKLASEGLKVNKDVTKTPLSDGKRVAIAQSQDTTEESAEGEQNQTTPYSNVDNSDPMDQVSNVSQFSDVRPGDWAYESLRELVERYGCIAGYPDSTYRGNRAMTRYEFAAGLRACLNQIEKLIAASTTNFATKEDLEKLRRLTEEFQAELAALGTRVDKLESRVSFLENHQFSTTTKLNGEVIIQNAYVAGTRASVPSGAPRSRTRLNDNDIISDRVRLNFDTSFFGTDRLRTRLEMNNTPNLGIPGSGTGYSGTNEFRLGYDGILGANGTGARGATAGNGLVLGRLEYRFAPTKSTTIFLEGTGGEFGDNFNTNNPFLESSGLGAFSRFGRFSPIYYISNTRSGTNSGTGATFVQKLGDKVSFSGGYLARTAQYPDTNRGFFNGTYAALAQINFQPTRDIGLGLSYAHAYYSRIAGDTGVTGAVTGSENANQPFGNGFPTSTNAYGAEASWRISRNINLSGWGELEYSTAEAGNGTTIRKGNHASSYNFAAALSFPDLIRKGDVAALIFGEPPRATRNDSRSTNSVAFGDGITYTTLKRRDANAAYQIEALYRIRASDHIYVTPGILVLIHPDNNSSNPPLFLGELRTTFTF